MKTLVGKTKIGAPGSNSCTEAALETAVQQDSRAVKEHAGAEAHWDAGPTNIFKELQSGKRQHS